MKLLHALLLGFFLIALFALNSSADSGVEGGSKPSLDPKTEVASLNATNQYKKVDQLKDEIVVVETSKEGNVHEDDKTKRKSSEQKESKPKEVSGVVTGNEGSNGKTKEKAKSDGKKDESSGNETYEVSVKGKQKERNEKPSNPLRKEGPRVEECDTPYKCTTKDSKLVACLMFPGNESPELSLLIQNKGDTPLSIEISAPDYVKLGEKSVQLKEKDRKEVKVSIPRSRSHTSSITLIGVKDNCSINLKDLFENTSIGSNKSSKSINFLGQTPVVAFAAFCGLLLLASAWMCIKGRRKLISSGELKYQRLDMELPVSIDRKPEPDVGDSWDDSWGDTWDDEEAPLTPSKPVTPSMSFSSKGLATRRAAKEGWKD